MTVFGTFGSTNKQTILMVKSVAVVELGRVDAGTAYGRCIIAATNSRWVFQTSVDVTLSLSASDGRHNISLMQSDVGKGYI